MFYAKLDAILIKRQDIDNAVVFCQSKNLFFYRISLLHSVNLIVVTSKWMGLRCKSEEDRVASLL